MTPEGSSASRERPRERGRRVDHFRNGLLFGFAAPYESCVALMSRSCAFQGTAVGDAGPLLESHQARVSQSTARNAAGRQNDTRHVKIESHINQRFERYHFARLSDELESRQRRRSLRRLRNERLILAAREAGCSEDEAVYDEKLKRIASATLSARANGRSHLKPFLAWGVIQWQRVFIHWQMFKAKT
jgi:hypothetical protein